jgi:hypothetical protein
MPSGCPRLPRLAAALVALSLFGFLSESRAQVIIAELMADNVNSAVIDEDGAHSDWLELQNTGATAVSLNGWYLTDNKADLQKWRFPVAAPAVNLAPGARLVVWCSGKNRKVAANKLHTNFSLERNGEYLGLIRPDGFTVEFEYNPGYPPQFSNSVYGFGNTTTQQEVLSETAPGKAQVATSLADFQANFTGWNTSPTFDDSSWQAGESGFGFDTTNPPQDIIGPLVSATGNLQAKMQGVNASCFVRYIINIPDPALSRGLTLKAKYDDGYICYLNGNKIAQTSYAPGIPNWDSGTVANIDRPDFLAATAEVISTPNAQNFLVAGNNVLAFQMMNNGVANETVLLRPQVLAAGDHRLANWLPHQPDAGLGKFRGSEQFGALDLAGHGQTSAADRWRGQRAAADHGQSRTDASAAQWNGPSGAQSTGDVRYD